jgi:photoactive yellow protein
MSTAMADTMWDQGTKMAAMSFVKPDVLAKLDSLSRAELDKLTFGVVKVDDAGVISEYNRYESELAGVPVSAALGKNFFSQLAPCTNNAMFYGNFKRGVAAKAYDLAFVYTFSYNMTPTPVRVHLHRTAKGTNWVLVKKK